MGTVIFMTQVSIPFSAHSSEDWQRQLLKELKESSNLLQYSNELEDLSFSLTQLDAAPLLPLINEPITWKRMVAGSATDEKKCNLYFLQALMQGADALLIDQTDHTTDWASLLHNIETPYISCLIVFRTAAAYEHFKTHANADALAHATPLFAFGESQNYFSAFDLQQIGANCTTQLAVSLYELQQQLKEQAFSRTLFVELGIGSEFLLEIAKLMAFRTLVAQLAQIHNCKLEVQIISKTGFCNKSLEDPYTNLLRLSTEGLSGVLGCANYICIQPYDALSKAGSSDFASRMALNIGNLLAEEAHLATLSAPLSGAYTIEKMSSLLIEKSWNLLYELDSDCENAEPLIQKSIANARAIRLERFEQKQDTLIGVNSYKNEFAAPKATWGKIPETYGFPYIIFEKISSND